MSKTQSNTVSVEWPFRYADCSGLKLPDESRCGLRRHSASLSINFETVDRFEMQPNLALIIWPDKFKVRIEFANV